MPLFYSLFYLLTHHSLLYLFVWLVGWFGFPLTTTTSWFGLQVRDLLVTLDPPLGLKGHHFSRTQMMSVLRVMHIPCSATGFLHYRDTLNTLVRRMYGSGSKVRRMMDGWMDGGEEEEEEEGVWVCLVPPSSSSSSSSSSPPPPPPPPPLPPLPPRVSPAPPPLY